MNPEIANILICPVCRHSLQLDSVRYRLGEITSGNIVCENCSLEFPIVLGRPLLLPPGAPQMWMNAIDEAVGWRGETRKMPEVLVWLASVGVEEAMRRLEKKQKQTQCDVFHRTGHRIPAVPVSQRLLNQARYRKYGRWFQASGRVSDGFRPRSWVLEYPQKPIPQNPNERDSVEEVVFQAIRLQPRRLLDVASGGGFCISRTLAHLPDFEFAIATERDLKATWIIQYKFKHIGVNERAEALGADARALPLFDNTFDVATCNHSLLEIQGNTQMLRETYRVLRPGGHFIISGICRVPRILPNGRPALPQGLTLEEYRRFAEAADLHHIDLDHFQSRVQTVGFEHVWVKTLMEEYNTKRSIERFVMIIRKGNAL